jgi:hypothetical protein
MILMTAIPLLMGILILTAYRSVVMKSEREYAKRFDPKYLADLDAPEDLQGQFSTRELNNFRMAFASVDVNGNGSIDAQELGEVVRKFMPECTDEDVTTMLSTEDTDENGEISFAEFLAMVDAARRKGSTSDFSDLVDLVDADVNRATGQSLFYGFLLLTFTVLAGVSSVLFGYFQCQEFAEAEGGARWFLVRDYSIDCDDERYLVAQAYAGLMMLIFPAG